MKYLISAYAGYLILATSTTAIADTLPQAADHAPIGVMADHFHKRGGWMISFRSMFMDMDGNLKGSSSIAPDQIVTTEPNVFFGNPGQPPNLRIVPEEMAMQMHMLGVMYAPTDSVTVMAMVNYLTKDMDHITYQGGSGTTVLGGFTTKTTGVGDSSVAALIRLFDNGAARLHGIVGASIPTGDLENRGEILTPMNTTPVVRLPYPMQLGSGTWDPIIGASFSSIGNPFAWGVQWRSTFRITDNDENYHLGNEHRLTGWASYSWYEPVSVSLRAEYVKRGDISGMDPTIMGPVQTADPGRHGGDRIDIGAGINLAGSGEFSGWRVAMEHMIPLSQDLDGPQLETDGTLTLGIQKSW